MMANLKYELTQETIKIGVHTLYRIRALRDFGLVKKGGLGGFVESRDNLSQEGACWIYDDACAYEDARIEDDAMILDSARVYGNSHIYECARVSGDAHVYDCAAIFGSANISDRVCVFGRSGVCGDINISGDIYLHGQGIIF